MKKIIKGIELDNKMDEAVNLLCDVVKMSLGPKGGKAIIDHSMFTPFITNDGVTIAKNIESDDIVINTILELAKEAAIKTDEKVGDGTTTTLVLLQQLYLEGRRLINDGKSYVEVKKMMDAEGMLAKKMLEKEVFFPKAKHLKNIAIIAAKDKEIGELVCDAFEKVRNKKGIIIDEGNGDKTEIIYKKGYIIDSILASPYYFQDKNEINLNKSYFLLINNYLEDFELLADIINEIIMKKQNLIILADDYDINIVSQIISLYLNEKVNILLLKIPGYGSEKLDLLKDIELISQAKIIYDLNDIKFDCLGFSERVIIRNDTTTISFVENNQIEDRCILLREKVNLEIDDFKKEFILKRLAMFETGLVEIKIGALTETERREKKMRFDDALGSIFQASEGILLGSGIILNKIGVNHHFEVIHKALEEPFKQIMINANEKKDEILKKIKESDYRIVYNVLEEQYENIEETVVLDAFNVIVKALFNAISIASMLLGTKCLVINENKIARMESKQYEEM